MVESHATPLTATEILARNAAQPTSIVGRAESEAVMAAIAATIQPTVAVVG